MNVKRAIEEIDKIAIRHSSPGLIIENNIRVKLSDLREVIKALEEPEETRLPNQVEILQRAVDKLRERIVKVESKVIGAIGEPCNNPNPIREFYSKWKNRTIGFDNFREYWQESWEVIEAHCEQ